MKYSIENIVNNDVITMNSASWILKILGQHFVKYIIVSPLYLQLKQNNIDYKLQVYFFNLKNNKGQNQNICMQMQFANFQAHSTFIIVY